MVDVTRNGDLDRLRFPLFQYDILQQRGWSPADDLGRIRLVISEGFSRGSATVPVERVKNVVAFSFQYAPLCRFKQLPGFPAASLQLKTSDTGRRRTGMAKPVALAALTRSIDQARSYLRLG